MTFFMRWKLISSLLLMLSSYASANIDETGGLAPFTKTTQGLLFTLEGSNTIGAALAPNWVKAYLEEKLVENVEIKPLVKENEYLIVGKLGMRQVYVRVNAHGSSTGFAGLRAGTADIAMSSRSIKSKELSKLKHLGDLSSSASEHVVAIDGLAIIVHPENPIKRLTVDEVGKIFSGKIKNWKSVGGEDRSISLYSRDQDSGTADTFRSLILGKRFKLAQSARLFESSDLLSHEVSLDKNAIGFVGLASINSSKALPVLVENAMPLKPEILHVVTEDYPLTRRLYLYHSQFEINPYVKEFISYTQTRVGQTIVEGVGYVSQIPKGVELRVEKGPQFYQNLSKRAKRLSVNFRFRGGSAELDNKAKRDIARLAKYLKLPENKSLVVQLVGFSDLEKTERRAKVLSRLRANAVKVELFNHGISSAPVEGVGSKLPVADSKSHSRSKNDRVEVWVFEPSVLASNI